LIDKYRNLIYSIPIKYRASPEDAADIFQSVCLELFSHLSQLRKPARCADAHHGHDAPVVPLEAQAPETDGP